MKTPMSAVYLVLLASFIGSFGAVLLKIAAGRLNRKRWQSVVFNWPLVAGVAAFLVSSVFFVAGVRQGELTVLYPMASLGYIWTLLWSKLFFHEPFTRNKFIGVGMILIGVVFLGVGGAGISR